LPASWLSARDVAVGRDPGPVGIVELVVIGLPFEAAERALGQVELHEVIIETEAAEDLQAGISEDVVNDAHPGGHLIVEAEFDRPVLISSLLLLPGEGRNILAFRPKPRVERETTADRPGVLEVQGPGVPPDVPEAAVRGGPGASDIVIAVDAPDRLAGGQSVEGFAPRESDQRVIADLVDVLLVADEPDPGLQGVLAAQAEKVGQVDRAREPPELPPVAGHGGAGPVRPAVIMEEIGMSREEWVVRIDEIRPGERIFRAGTKDLLVGCVLLGHGCPGAHQEVVSERVIQLEGPAEVRVIEPDLGIGRVRVAGPGDARDRSPLP